MTHGTENARSLLKEIFVPRFTVGPARLLSLAGCWRSYLQYARCGSTDNKNHFIGSNFRISVMQSHLRESPRKVPLSRNQYHHMTMRSEHNRV